MSKRNLVLLALLSGILLSPAWFTWGSGLFLLFALVPLLWVEYELSLNPSKYKKRLFFWLPFLSFAVFNTLTTWWIKNAAFAGIIVAVLLNSTLMSTAFYLFSLTRRKLGDGFGYFSLVFYWIGYEYLYLHGQISWTWLNFGNGFAHNIRLIQWYEFTGSTGGTLWVLISNILLFKLLRAWISSKSLSKVKAELVLLLIILIVPVSYSLIRFYTYKEKVNPYQIVVLQPNIDPYQKFNDIPPDEQMDILLNLAKEKTDSLTDYIVAPETYINDNLWLDDMESNPSIIRIRQFLKNFPKAKMVIGATTYKYYPSSKEASETSRPFRNGYYDSFNSSLQIDSTSLIQYYHKSQLVVGVEKMPYAHQLRFLQKIMLHLGGTFRSHGIQKERSCLYSPQDGLSIATPICYESIFGEFVSDYLVPGREGIIFVITNDGWWGDTPGYVQHNSFSSLRAIENRRSVARSANTGISSFINQKGEVLQTIGWWKRDSIKATLNANDKITFYTRYGDYIGRISVFFGLFFLLYTLVKILMTFRFRKKS
ncbi:MAG: apolipoprotein N-acyltransferase [Bacteroidales bacterium]|nr:apolipoprotein N-acyltransferase [Bacteroidales bacterium]MCB8999285.1 apolipoprotein N-acyltransferase [Bacteroidales bacterium]MCB9013045.1 apolipoprotein N-acyltransferase [Bacteroidales bacterium]